MNQQNPNKGLFVPTQIVLHRSSQKPRQEGNQILERKADNTQLADSVVVDSDITQLEGKKGDEARVVEKRKSSTPSGNVPNIFWRCIPLEDLRLHPLFVPLPRPSDIIIQSKKDLCLFRQNSPQWDLLHRGRLTTSSLASILGFYEKSVATYLNIPSSLTSHGRVVESWGRLCQKPIHNWMNLYESRNPEIDDKEEVESTIWQPLSTTSSNQFPYQYQPYSTPSHYHYQYCQRIKDAIQARMIWGSVQEATAILAALNYFATQEINLRLCESGMFLIEALDSYSAATSSSSMSLYQTIHRMITRDETLPLLGASPDAIIQHENGQLEILEVKCFCPFINITHSTSSSRFHLSFRPPSHHQRGIPVWHVPQLQWEMLCAGSQCQAGYMIILYADGADIYRIPRDEEVSNLPIFECLLVAHFLFCMSIVFNLGD
jgi:hypothetical protein